MHYLDNLRQLREDAGLTINEAAAKLEVSRERLRRWETGESGVDLANLAKLAELYDAQIYVPVTFH